MRLLYILPGILQRIIWLPTRFILVFFGHLEVSGLENFAQLPTGVIFAVNHGSEADAIIVPVSLSPLSRHFGMFYTSRKREFYKKSGWRKRFYGGWLFNLLGAYPVVIGKKDYEVSLKNHIELLQQGRSVCIFPEGKKTLDGALQESHGGVGYLVWRTSRPVVPVAISGVFQITVKDFFCRKRYLSVAFGKPLYRKDLFGKVDDIVITNDHDDCRLAAKKIMFRIQNLLNTMHS